MNTPSIESARRFITQNSHNVDGFVLRTWSRDKIALWRNAWRTVKQFVAIDTSYGKTKEGQVGRDNTAPLLAKQ